MAQIYRPYEGQSAMMPPPPPSSYYSAPVAPVYGTATAVSVEQPGYETAPYGVSTNASTELEATEAAVNAAAATGKDVTRARNHLRLAKFFNNKGDVQKTNDYCRKTKEAIQ